MTQQREAVLAKVAVSFQAVLSARLHVAILAVLLGSQLRVHVYRTRSRRFDWGRVKVSKSYTHARVQNVSASQASHVPLTLHMSVGHIGEWTGRYS